MGTLPIQYERRRPETSILYQLVSEHMETFFKTVESRPKGRVFPSYVRKEFQGYLNCGRLDQGFLKLVCDGCEKTHLLAFSCKMRGFCPSCGARRMCQTAAYLVDRVLPYAPYRQYVVSFPFAMRYWLSSKPRLTTAIVGIINHSIMKYTERRAKEIGYSDVKTGTVTFLQRFGGFINLNLHAHILVLDGFYHRPDPNRSPKFVPLPPPTDEEVAGLCEMIARRVIRCLQRKELLPKDGDLVDGYKPAKDDLHDFYPPMAESVMASCQQQIAFGERAGQPLRFKGYGSGFGSPGEKAIRQSRRCATANGHSLHCNVAVAADKRQHLEQLLRYMARSSISLTRLSQEDDGQVVYKLKKAFRGKTHLVLSPLEFMEKLSALIPPARMHMNRHHGVFAPNAEWRKLVVVEGLGKLIAESLGEVPKPARPKRELPKEERYTWAMMLRRTYNIDLTICPDCQGRVRIRSKVTEPSEATKIIAAMGLTIRPPPTQPSRVMTVFDEYSDAI